jgi:hypothetical protein
MRKLIRLYGPSGCDEANFGTERFVKHEAGYFDVPEEAVEGLLKVGGFIRAPDQPAADEGAHASPPLENPFDSLGDPVE